MAANYPSSLPVKTVAGSTLAANPHSSLHNKMWEEVVAIATELGTNVSGSYSTLAARLDTVLMGKTTWNSGTVTQSGTVSKTINRSVYYQWGQSIHWFFNYTMTGSGTAGNAIVLSIPHTTLNASALIGPALVRTGSTSYTCMMLGASTSTVKLYTEGYTTAGVGASPSFALASGHTIQGYIIYPLS